MLSRSWQSTELKKEGEATRAQRNKQTKPVLVIIKMEKKTNNYTFQERTNEENMYKYI